MSTTHDGYPIGDITEVDANHVLSVNGEGYEPGGFTAALMETMFRADPMNMVLLTSVYPGLGQAVTIYRGSSTGIYELRRIAGL